jgi:preprotein translocase subunit SecE
MLKKLIKNKNWLKQTGQVFLFVCLMSSLALAIAFVLVKLTELIR